MASSVSLQVVPNRNACGACTACCDILGIPDLGKPFYSRCRHLLPNKGCGIYADRPKECISFRCGWHAGVLGESMDRRPDKCGLMFDLCPGDNPPRLNVWEVIPGALNRDNLQYLIEKVRAHKLVRGVRFGRPAVVLYPYGSKMGLQFQVADEYRNWTPPVSPTMQLLPAKSGIPDQAIFAGEIEALRMPISGPNPIEKR